VDGRVDRAQLDHLGAHGGDEAPGGAAAGGRLGLAAGDALMLDDTASSSAPGSVRNGRPDSAQSMCQSRPCLSRIAATRVAGLRRWIRWRSGS
jgi:hypothetical protein